MEPTDYHQVLHTFTLTDVTDDEGAIWDTKSRVVKTPYWDASSRQKLWHEGDRSWLNFRGMWGNRGVDDCWWHRLIAICQVSPNLAANLAAITGRIYDEC